MGNPFNVLLDRPPETVEVNGRSYPVASDYRVALAYFRLMGGDDDDQDKALFSLSLFFGSEMAPDDIPELQKYIGWFLRRGRDEEPQDKKARVFDMLEDSGRVFAAFYQIYKINLRTARVHWWVFCELLEGLPKGTHLSDVIEIRGKKFEKWMKPADRNELQQIKDRYRIGPKVSAMDALFSMLKGVAR